MIENEIAIGGKFTMKVHFNLVRKGDSDYSQIWLTTTIGNKRARLYTGQRVKEEFWIKKSRTEIGEKAKEGDIGNTNNQHNKAVNKELSKILGYCREYGVAVSESNLVDKPLEHNVKNFMEYISDRIRGFEVNARKNPVDYINNYIERKSKTVNRETKRILSDGTIYNHRNALSRLQNFCHDKHLCLVWDLFNSRLEENLTEWMNEHGYSANTIASQYSIMKVWLSEAEDEGIITDKSFHQYPTSTKEVDNIYLTEAEIQKIYDIDFSSDEVKSQIDTKSMIEVSRDLFVIACWTGLRFGDWNSLSNADITDDTLTVMTHKTNKKVVIPLHPFVKAIIEKYNGTLPNAIDKAHCLVHIRKCGELAGINEEVVLNRIEGGRSIEIREPKYKLIMNHTARRSFATNMYLKNIPIVSIMAITGHTTEANFLKYIKISAEEHARIVAKAFESK